MTQVIGPCQFTDLPKFYQDQFISGNIKSFIHYYPCKLPQNAIFAAIFFGLAYLTYAMGNHGLWLAFFVFMLTRGLTLAVNYRKLSK